MPTRAGWLALALAGVAIAVHLAALDVPFVYDDGRTVTHNPSLDGDLARILRHERFRPLTNASYALDARLWGTPREPWGFHLTGLLLHGLVVGLVGLVVWRRGKASLGAAALAAGVVAVHPLAVQSVGYVSGRAGLWVAVWLLLGLLAYRRAVSSGQARWLIPVGLCWVLAAASKETGAMLPALLLLDDLCLADDDGRSRRIRRLLAPALALLAVGGLARVGLYVAQERGGGQQLQTVLTQLGVSWRYVRLFVAPLGQTVVHLVPQSSPLDPGLWLRLGALVGGAAAVWRLRRRAPGVAFGLAWYGVILAPTTLIPLDEHLAEQRAYLPLLGLAQASGAAGAWLAARLRRQDPRAAVVARVAALIWLVGLAGLTQLRYRVWASPRALWTEAVTRAGPDAPDDLRLRHSPIHATPFNNLGFELLNAGRVAEAERRFTQAIAMRPSYTEAYSNRGAARWARGDFDGALADFEQALAQNPNNAMAATNRGMLRARRGDVEGALADFTHALNLFPRLALARAARGKVYERREQLAAAAEDFLVAREEAPQVPGGWLGGARIALAQDRPDEALAILMAAREHLPDERDVIERGIVHCRERLAGP